jgi:hypothetical protein
MGDSEPVEELRLYADGPGAFVRKARVLDSRSQVS